MPDDRTTRAKRALELASKATEGPMQVELGYLTCCDGPERVVVSAPARDSADGLSGYCVASFGTDDAALCDAQLFAESRTLLPQLARDLLELEAECGRLREQVARMDRELVDQRSLMMRAEEWERRALAGQAENERLRVERDAARESRERAAEGQLWAIDVLNELGTLAGAEPGCSNTDAIRNAINERAWQRDIIASFQEHNNGAQPPLKTIELAKKCEQLRTENERLRAVIRTGGAMYRLERSALGVPGGIVEDDVSMMRAELAAARAENERLRSALEPLACCGEDISPDDDDDDRQVCFWFSTGEIRRARAAAERKAGAG